MASASEWLQSGAIDGADIVLLGAPISRASISPSEAWRTPAAFRAQLARFATWDGDRGVDLAMLRIGDAGDVVGDRDDADADAAHQRIAAAVVALDAAPVVAVVGGDNSLTYPAMRARAGDGGLDHGWGLITLDAHHDVRELDRGPRNGTPVRQLVEAGLPGDRVVQVGIHGFANARAHAEYADAHNFLVRRASAVRSRGVATVIDEALNHLGDGGVERIWVDFDIDVVDRAYAPGCPASMPGGLTPVQLCDAAWRLGATPAVAGIDLCEVDSAADINAITVRLMCATLLAFCSGLCERKRRVQG